MAQLDTTNPNCGRCGKPQNSHKPVNYSMGNLVSPTALLCPLATFIAADHATFTDRWTIDRQQLVEVPYVSAGVLCPRCGADMAGAAFAFLDIGNSDLICRDCYVEASQ